MTPKNSLILGSIIVFGTTIGVIVYDYIDKVVNGDFILSVCLPILYSSLIALGIDFKREPQPMTKSVGMEKEN